MSESTDTMPGMDSPNPGDPQHEHLFPGGDVGMARAELRKPLGRVPIVSRCVLCGKRVDLTETVRPFRRRERTGSPSPTSVADVAERDD